MVQSVFDTLLLLLQYSNHTKNKLLRREIAQQEVLDYASIERRSLRWVGQAGVFRNRLECFPKHDASNT